jgi:hypothetical protein
VFASVEGVPPRSAWHPREATMMLVVLALVFPVLMLALMVGMDLLEERIFRANLFSPPSSESTETVDGVPLPTDGVNRDSTLGQ